MDWLKQIAPTIATALGGPLAGMAVSAISKAIGVDEDKVGDLIANNKLTAEQIAQVKLAEIELQKQAQELGLNFEKLEVEDRANARAMQVAAIQSDDPFVRRYIYYFITFWSLFSASYIPWITFGVIPEDNVRFADTILGFLLGTMVSSMFAFLLGSSLGSRNKDKK